ncbi:DegV family protein [Catenisphaera adipataccumulans]|jgi:DegV family protein with EDD domain|uniref:DegV family protein with EDD domain n=1 Tax=Catenisphaera adipataccumulans TaxID=700500 RepID=A0A7W8FY78_9FIRM|nr:DegV family protein [Catenisphaera adipataccumulans]MBB5183727.1 DegV family protein with EDD domain [Catenisphaera adipataccumulans]
MMTRKVRVVTESGGCLTRKQAADLDIDILPMQIFIDDKSYDDGVDLDAQGLYDLMEDGSYAMTSQPKAALAEELFAKYKKEGVTDVIAVNMSPGLSGTNALMLSTGKQFDIPVYTTDTFTTLAIEGYWTKAARQLVEQGVEPEEIIRRLAASTTRSCGYLLPYDLNHLAKGGRLTPFAAKFANMLQIKPICVVSIDTKGKVGMSEKVRTMKKAIRRTFELCQKGIAERNGDDYHDYVFYLMDSRNPEAMAYGEELMAKFFPDVHYNKDVLSPVINCHTGMKSFAIQYAPRVEGTTIE